MRREALHRSAGGAFRTLGRDPLGILAPAAGVLLLQLFVLLATREAFGALPLEPFAVLVGGLWILHAVVAVPLRGALIAAGARTLGRDTRALPRLPALLVVELLVALLVAGITAIVVTPFLLGAVFLATRGRFVLASLSLAAGAVLAAVAALLVRAAFAYVPVEVVVGKRGPIEALQRGVRASAGDLARLATLLIAGDGLIGMGALFCGVGALPGYPFSHLAVLHRWATATAEET